MRGTAKRAGFHYPKSLVSGGYLYVAYCTNKEDVEYTRVPISSIFFDTTYPLPDPLTLNNGNPVLTADKWRNIRRDQILTLFEQNMQGETRVGTRAATIKHVVREEITDARAGRATRLRIGILFEGTEEGRQMEMLVYLPNNAVGPVPMFLGLNFDGNFSTTTEPDIPITQSWVYSLYYSGIDNHVATAAMRGHNASMWPYNMILDRGYGIATIHYTDIEPDMDNQWWHGPRVWNAPLDENDWGSIGAWAWALSRALDWMETEERIDAEKVAVLGFSRLGKTAMWAGAQDERFAAVVSQCSGKGGVSLSKRMTGEPISNLVTKFPHWYSENYQQYVDNEENLPVDGHMLASLIAPRGLLILSGATDSWSDPEGEFLSGVAATPVYNLLGSEGMAATNWPTAGTLINSPIGYYMHATGHDVTTDDWEATLDWADVHLDPPDGYHRLEVDSPCGDPEPSIGLNPIASGSVVTCSVPQTVSTGQTNFACSGWIGSGDVPESGASNSTGPFTLTQDSTISWQWEVDGYALNLWIEGNGACNQYSDFYAMDEQLELTATPEEGWLFVEWTGDLTGDYTSQSTNLVMNAVKNITAVFSDDADGDGILNTNEYVYGTSPRKADSDGDGMDDRFELFVCKTDPTTPDTDGDGVNDRAELYVYLTDPFAKDSDSDGFDDGFEVATGYNPASDESTPDLFSMIKPAVEVQFCSTSNVSYRIEATATLSNAWTTIESGIVNEGPVVKRLYSVESQPNRFFRVRYD